MPVPGSRLVPIVIAGALVVIAVAVVVFVLRAPGRAGQPLAEGPPAATTAQPVQGSAPVETPPASGQPPAGGAPAVSITDDLAQQTESARALYRAGKYGEAARAAGRVLQQSPGHPEAQRLMADVARYARQAAAEALSGLGAARGRAEATGAHLAAGGTFSRALQAERNARTLFRAGDYARAAAAGYEAQGLFDAATAEAPDRAGAKATLAPPPAAPPPVAASSSLPRADPTLPPVATVPAPIAIPPPSPPSPPAPQAATAAAGRPANERLAPERQPDPQDAIRRALQQYVSALEARSLPALKQVWPGLAGAQERAISAEFGNARGISVSLDSPRIQVSGDTATVVATRRYALSTLDGHELRNETRTTLQLRLVGPGWVIDSVRFEAER